MRYSPGLPPALQGVTLQLRAGERLAIVSPRPALHCAVAAAAARLTTMSGAGRASRPGCTPRQVGATGAGKSSLVLALLQLLRLERGTLMVDGVDAASMSIYKLRQLFGVGASSRGRDTPAHRHTRADTGALNVPRGRGASGGRGAGSTSSAAAPVPDRRHGPDQPGPPPPCDGRCAVGGARARAASRPHCRAARRPERAHRCVYVAAGGRHRRGPHAQLMCRLHHPSPSHPPPPA